MTKEDVSDGLFNMPKIIYKPSKFVMECEAKACLQEIVDVSWSDEERTKLMVSDGCKHEAQTDISAPVISKL